MKVDRWQRVQTLFFTALDRQPAERAAFLDEACGGDSDLMDRVRALLAAHDGTGRFDRLAGGLASVLAPASDSAALPERIGAYRILRELGRGGMGTVFLADRSDGQFEHRVALKLLRLDLPDENLHRRFLAERQILAHLDHPHIARLFDGGLTENGRPYFVMEYVEGVPIDAYCDAERLGLEERLELFRTVCDAVHYAHRHLVVHRDLKPSNILVTEDGVVKLLDFGIAKLLDETAFPQSIAVTEAGMWVMTPECASPEQVRGEEITTASDVYQLGILLYRLLTGHRPYRLPGRSLPEVTRVVCETPPGKPSTAVGQVESIDESDGSRTEITPETVSRARRTSAERLRRRLRGDLDNIVLLALRKEPERRYGSVEKFSEDVRRYLGRLPVTARQDTVWYRVSTFVRRNRLATAAVVAILLLVAAFGAATVLQARRTAQERDKAEHVASFLVDLFQVSDPGEARGNTVTAREILDRGSERVRRELGSNPQVRAEMMDVIGRVYVNLGLFEEAAPLLEEALALRRESLGPVHVDVAASLHSLAVLQLEEGDHEAAQLLYQQALTMRRDLLSEPHADVADSLNGLGLLFVSRTELDRAEPLIREALAMRRELFGEVHSEVATSLNNLAYVLQLKGDYEEAERRYREALELKRALYGDLHPDLAVSTANLGWLLRARGDLDAAESLFRNVLAMRRQLYGERHPYVARSLSALADLLIERSEYEEAERLVREALAMRRELLGDDHPDLANDLYSLAKVMQRRGDPEAAESLYRESIALDQRSDTARALNALADLMEDRGDLASAESLYRESWTIYRENLGDAHPFAAIVQANVGAILYARGLDEEADPVYWEALQNLRAAWGDEHPRVIALTLRLGRLLVDRRDFDRAEPLLVEAYATVSGLEDRSDQAREALEQLVELYQAEAKADEAARYQMLLSAL